MHSRLVGPLCQMEAGRNLLERCGGDLLTTQDSDMSCVRNLIVPSFGYMLDEALQCPFSRTLCSLAFDVDAVSRTYGRAPCRLSAQDQSCGAIILRLSVRTHRSVAMWLLILDNIRLGARLALVSCGWVDMLLPKRRSSSLVVRYPLHRLCT